MKGLYSELIKLLLNRAGLKEKDIYDTAMKLWASKNLDLLSAAEREKFRSVIMQ
jgi:hypothetical protein